MAATPLVFTMMTLYCAYLSKILALGGEARSSTVDLSSSVRCCKCFRDRNPQIRLRFGMKKDSEKPKTACTTCKACIYPAVCNIQFI